MAVVKTKAISDWPVPLNLKQVQYFLRFANFYQHSNSAHPTHLEGYQVQLGVRTPSCFQNAQACLHTGPILSHCNPQDPIIVETEASDYTIMAILSQISPIDGNLHPLTFYSRSMAPTELNYEIYDKELLAIFDAFQHWQNYLEGSTQVVLVLSNHKNLEYFAITKQLTCQQVHWSEYLSGFNYLIRYRTGCLGTKPDTLTRLRMSTPGARMCMH